ncbi:MAG TPA: hypothetical protein VIU61_15700 [Kofleriaceae bacterium]
MVVTLLILLFGLVIGIYLAIEALDDEPRRCPSCGLASLAPVFRPKSGAPTHHCTKCGAEYRRE